MIDTDQTFDYMKVDTNQNVSDLLNVFFTQGLLPTVKRPTRIQVPRLLTTYMQNVVDMKILIPESYFKIYLIICLYSHVWEN